MSEERNEATSSEDVFGSVGFEPGLRTEVVRDELRREALRLGLRVAIGVSVPPAKPAPVRPIIDSTAITAPAMTPMTRPKMIGSLNPPPLGMAL